MCFNASRQRFFGELGYSVEQEGEEVEVTRTAERPLLAVAENCARGYSPSVFKTLKLLVFDLPSGPATGRLQGRQLRLWR